MRNLISALKADSTYKVDFSLVPIAIIIVEVSVFITQFTRDFYGQLNKIVLLRIVHTLAMLLIASFVAQSFKQLRKSEVNYRTMALTGFLFIALGDVLHGFLASLLGVELISNMRRFGIIVVQGCIWFPAFMIVVGNRREIIRGFKDYEQRLIVAARARSRSSNEFKVMQKAIQERIRLELLAACGALRNSIANGLQSGESLPEQYLAIRTQLVGEDLRKLSRNLETSKSKRGIRTSLSQSFKRFYLWQQQFRILYKFTILNTPMRQSSYAVALLAIVTPPYIYFYSLQEIIFTYPILFLSVFCITHLVLKVQSTKSAHIVQNLSILIFVTGLLPFAINLIQLGLFENSQSHFPILITGLFLPLTYFLFMMALQVLRPRALNLVRSENLIAGDALQGEISKIVSNEFSQNVSHQWAIYIHGKILTRLAATSLKLESISQVGDVQSFKDTVQSLLTLLDNPDSDFEEISTDLHTQVTSRLNPWTGLLDINLHIDPELLLIQGPRVRDLGEVIEELISNSIRHGKSKKIDLRILHSGASDVEIIAIDDAPLAPSQNGEMAGLGTRIFNLASDGRWSITREGSSTVFRLVMGLRG